jgi:hypothetical protein
MTIRTVDFGGMPINDPSDLSALLASASRGDLYMDAAGHKYIVGAIEGEDRKDRKIDNEEKILIFLGSMWPVVNRESFVEWPLVKAPVEATVIITQNY